MHSTDRVIYELDNVACPDSYLLTLDYHTDIPSENFLSYNDCIGNPNDIPQLLALGSI